MVWRLKIDKNSQKLEKMATSCQKHLESISSELQEIEKY